MDPTQAKNIQEATHIRLVAAPYRGKGDIVPVTQRDAKDPTSYTFKYQSDTYLYNPADNSFAPISYPTASKPPLLAFNTPSELYTSAAPEEYTGKAKKYIGLEQEEVKKRTVLYGKNEFDIPIPSFASLFAEHAVAPFFVFQIFCVALWVLDEYWYYSSVSIQTEIQFVEALLMYPADCSLYSCSLCSSVPSSGNVFELSESLGPCQLCPTTSKFIALANGPCAALTSSSRVMWSA